MMKKKRIFIKSISLLLTFALIFGIMSAQIKVWAGDTDQAMEEEEENKLVPWDGYMRITLENYGITASTGNVGTTYNTSQSGTYQGGSLSRTYLDVDVNLHGTFNGDIYFHYFGSDDWIDNIRFCPKNDGRAIQIKDWYREDKTSDTYVSRDEDIWIENTEYGISSNEYFNIKILTDIVANPEDIAKEDITLTFYLNEKYAGIMKWTEEASTVHDNFYIYCSSGSFSLRTPTMDPWSGYTRITMENYDITASASDKGSTYDSNLSGIFTGTSMHKTYLDVDVNFHGTFDGTSYFHFGGSDDWEDIIRISPNDNGTGMLMKDWYREDKTLGVYESRAEEIWIDNEAFGISPNEFFNIKILTEIITNPNDTTKEDVSFTFYLNEIYAGTMTWTEEVHSNHNHFYFYCPSGSYSLRTPTVQEIKPDITFELSADEGYLLTGEGTLFVDEVERTAGTTIKAPGDYKIKRVENLETAYIQNVSLYRIGDVNLDGESWTADDKTALEIILAGSTNSKAAMKSADINNDGKVAESDLVLLDKIISGVLNSAEVMKQYHAPAITYDYLGGDGVMPIGGFYGPYSEETVTDEIYKLMADSGVNLITSSNVDYGDENNRELIERGLALAEKYGIGIYVRDGRLNSVTVDENSLVTDHHSVGNIVDVATLLGNYSTYQSFLGTMIMDEPILDNGFNSIATDDYRRFKYYKEITMALNSYDNITGYVNLLSNYHMDKEVTYEGYLREIGETMKLLSFDSYPFYEKEGSSGGLSYYLQSLGIISTVAREDGYPFWSYVQAGTDHRDDGAKGATSEYLTEAQTLWNVNTSLAFGAKGIMYFPLLQPTYYAYDGSENGEYDYNRNGIIGADHKTNKYYKQVQKANEQITAVDEVLMKAENQGVMVTGKAVDDTTEVSNVIANTSKLLSVSGDHALVGCFNYQDTEAFYVVGYDYNATEDQIITLHFSDNYQYRLIQDANTSYGEGSSCTLTVPAGAGVLVVLEEHIVYYEDILKYRSETGYTAPEAPAGYLFAGWYADKACSTPIGSNVKTTDAYAKFVDANLLTVKAQITAGTKIDSSSTSIRFVTTVNDLRYSKIGFKIHIWKDSGVDKRDYASDIVYKELSSCLGKTNKIYTPQDFCYTATYFKAQVIQKIPNSSFETVFEVTPYWKTLDGTTVRGSTVTKTVRQGIE